MGPNMDPDAHFDRDAIAQWENEGGQQPPLPIEHKQLLKRYPILWLALGYRRQPVL